jgi:DNA-binding SARP family transcriptional activator
VRPKVLTLLRLLCLSLGMDVHRETLMEALWPEAPAEVGTHRLQVAVSGLRGALEAAGLPGAELLERRGEAYRFSLPPGASVDVAELEDAVAEASAARSAGNVVAAGAAARRALGLYRGDLLPGDGPAEWIVEARGRLRHRVSAAARELAEDCLAVADERAGVEAARRSLELEPFQDGVWELLSRLHQQAGDQAAAEHALRQRWHAVADLSQPARPRPDVAVPRPRTALGAGR